MPRDQRPFITIHDGMPEHPKIEGLSDSAFRLLVETWCWCSRNKTDGRVRQASWSKRGNARSRRELIEAGLAELGEDGVTMHDYLDHQRSASEIEELSRVRSEAGRKGGKAKASATANARASAVANGKQNGSKPVADTDTERARHTSSSSARVRANERRTKIPDDWKPTPADVEWQRREGVSDLTARRELPVFVDHWKAKGEPRADWSASWRNWLRRADEFRPRAVNAQPKVSTEW